MEDARDASGAMTTPHVIYETLHQQLEWEISARDSLTSRAVSFLGFLGVFLAVLVSVSVLSPGQSKLVLELLAFPIFLQLLAAFFLFLVISGYSLVLGPALPDIIDTLNQNGDIVRLGVAISYGTSVLTNRILQARLGLWFRIAIVVVALSLVQLGLSVGASSVDSGHASVLWVVDWILYVPGLIMLSVGLAFLYLDYRRFNQDLTQELRRWQSIVGRPPGEPI